MVSDRGGRFGFVYAAQQDVYRALRRKGYSEKKSAAIANAQHGGNAVKRGSGGRSAKVVRRTSVRATQARGRRR